MSQKSKTALGFLAGLAAIALAGFLWYSFTLRELSAKVGREVSLGVDLVTAAADADTLGRLTLNVTDKELPEYLALRELFSRTAMTLRDQHIRGLYAMKVANGEVRFIVDSAPESDPWHSEPGVVYQEPPAAVFEAQTGGTTKFVGPYTDEYGSFYSVFSPMLDDRGETVAVVGGDVEAATFDALVSDRARFLLASLFAALSAYCGLFLLVSGYRQRKRWLADRQAERYRAAREREMLLMNIGDGVVACNDEGIVTFANPYALKAVGVRRGDAVGKPFGDHWAVTDQNGNDLPEARQPLAAGGKSGRASAAAGGYVYLRRKDGSLLPVLWSQAVVRGEGVPTLRIMTFRDFSREAEIDKMKSDFISVATHQIKTPLTALKWIASTLAAPSPTRSEDDKEAIGQLTQVVDRLDGLVRALLNVSRIESGKLSIEAAPISLPPVAKDVVSELGFRIKEKRQRVTVEAKPGLPDARADRNLIREVYKNLISNAVKYTPEGGHIRVAVALDGKNLVSSVKDDGYGIPDAERDRVFAKFFRGTNVLGLDEEGTGLGLYYAKQVVEASGGKLWFETSLGKGTTFHFSLPLAGGKPKKSGAPK